MHWTLRRAMTLEGPARTVMKARRIVNQDEGLHRSHALSAAALVLLTPRKYCLQNPSVKPQPQICSPVVQEEGST